MIANLEELALRCGDESARTNIGEAIKCYQSGAYRAAIVNAYVAVCFDLIEKLKILAANGDGAAKGEEKTLQKLQKQNDEGDPTAIKGLLEFERGLLELFKNKFDFFGKHEFDELSRLREDRNRCAHPTFAKSSVPFAPSAELARLHIRNALVHVLLQYPRQGKAAVDSLEKVVLSTYFPKNVSDAVKRLQGSELKNARPALVRAFLDRLCFGAADKTSPLFMKRPGQVAVEAALEMDRTEGLPRLATNINKLLKSTNADEVYVGCVLTLRTPEAAELVDDAGKTVVKEWVKSPPTGVDKGNMVCRGISIDWLRDSVLKALPGLEASDFGKISLEPIPKEVISQAAQLYCSARSWTQANTLASDFVIGFASKFSNEDLDDIIQAAAEGEADLLGSHGFSQFLDVLFEESASKKAKTCDLLKKHGLDRYLPKD